MYNTSGGMKLISDADRQVYEIINFVIITSVISLFGVITNLMNILVFYKQGFNNTINISFFGLAISDLCSLLSLLWFCVCVNPLFVNSSLPMVSSEIQHLSAGIPHICFVRITGWITIYITAERCLCIMIPLKIKQVITPRRTTSTVCIIYTVIIVSFAPEYATTYIDWKFYPNKNRTLLGLIFTSQRKNTEGIVFFLYSIMGSASFVAIVTFTITLVVQLRQKSKWRKKANVDQSRAESMSIRERKTVTMVITIAVVSIVCYAPGVAVSMVTFFEREFSIIGSSVNAFFVLWSFVFIFEATNSSINIILYYNMSTKYRETFQQVFCRQGTTT